MNDIMEQHISRAVVSYRTERDDGSGTLNFSVDICGINEASNNTQAVASNYFTTKIESSIEAFSDAPVAGNHDGAFLDDRLSFGLFEEGASERNLAIVEHLQSELKKRVFHEIEAPSTCEALISKKDNYTYGETNLTI